MQGKLKRFLFRVLCGFFLGISVIAPGVSGSIMAVMMGIYRDLINIISNPFKNFKRNIIYLTPIGLGAVISLVLLVKLLAFAFDAYPTQSMLLFMGLISGGLLEVLNQARKVSFKSRYLIGIVAAFGIALAVGFIGSAELSAGTNQVSIGTLCIAGAVAGISSMVPGMSISLILMLFGVYDFLLRTASGMLKDLHQFISVAIPVGVCFIVGMVLFSNITKLIFDRYPGFAYFLVFGFLCGTLTAIMLNLPPAPNGAWIVCVLLFIVGLLISMGFQWLGNRFNTEET